MTFFNITFACFITSLLLRYAASCELMESKRTCECWAMHSVQGNESIKLFDVPSYDDCGINLGCEKLDCGKRCLNKVRQVLGGQEDFLTQFGKDKTCQLVARKNETISGSGIKLWAEWKYSSCRSGREPIIQDLCCNKKCSCQLKSQKVTGDLDDTSFKQIEDFSKDIVYKEISYECVQYKEIEDCQFSCMDRVGNYLNRQDIKKPRPNKLNLNVFSSDKYASEKICSSIAEPITKPGTDIYVQIDALIPGAQRVVNLGRVCCENKCECEFLFINATSNEEVLEPLSITNQDPNIKLNNGYECSNELSDCMSYCRSQAFSRFKDRSSLEFDANKTSYENDYLKSDELKRFICNRIKIIDGKVGYSVYLRYTNQKSPYPKREDLFVGRLCCKQFDNNFIGINRCNTT